MEKVTCVDGTVINEDDYKFVEERNAKTKEENNQRYTDAKYCGIKQINERIDKCNTIDESGENVPLDKLDTTGVSENTLIYEDGCDTYKIKANRGYYL